MSQPQAFAGEDRSFEALLAQWSAFLAQELRLSAHTISAYQRDLSAFSVFLSDHLGAKIDLSALNNVQTSDLTAYLSRRSRGDNALEAASRARALSAIRAFYRFLSVRFDVDAGVVARYRGPKIPARAPRAPAETEVDGLIDAAELDADEPWIAARNVAILTLIYGCGLRISEGLALQQRQIPLQSVLLVRGKGNKERRVPVLPLVQAAIADYIRQTPWDLSPEEPIFRGARGGPLHARIVQGLLQKLRRQLGLPESVTPHALRHAFATHMLRNGADLRAIQDLLGHAHATATQIYAAHAQDGLIAAFKRAHPRADRPKD
ncbi:MAG TPA: recombinase XerC [Hyphomonadaceae bacterium]|nr:recombinase XerC [Hyphomonadaceae bacterium]